MMTDVAADLATLRDMKYLTPREAAAVKGVEAELARLTQELERWERKQIRPQEIVERLQAAERALAETREALRDIADYGISRPPVSGWSNVVSADVVEIARRALAASAPQERA